MKKRLLSLTVAIVLAVSMLTLPSFAATDVTIKLEVNGENYVFDEELGLPYLDSANRTMVPLRSVSYALGLAESDVSWDEDTQTAKFTQNGRSVSFKVGSTHCTITEGEDVSYMYMNTAPVLKDGHIYLPIRYLAVALGYHVGWDGATATVSLTKAAESDPVVNIYLTRHGKTMFNTVKRVQGWCDTPLTEAGAKVASDLGKGLKASGVTFVAAYSSDLGRQRETAHLVLDELGLDDMPLTELFGLREVCYGSWEGELESVRDAAFCEAAGVHSIYEIYEAGGSLLYDVTIETDTSGTAESLKEVQTRMMAALTQIAKETEAIGGGNVLAVSSGGITSSLVEMFRGYGLELPNASVTMLTYTDEVFIMGAIGDTSYSTLGATVE